MKVENNKVVTFHYTLKFDSGEVFDSTTLHNPVNILVGQHQVIPGLEKAIMGMRVGETKDGIIEPRNAYGYFNEKLVKAYPRKFIPSSIALHIGRIIKARKKNGQMVNVVVKSYNETEVVLDLNHPGAGQKVNFKTRIINIREATPEELQSGTVH